MSDSIHRWAPVRRVPAALALLAAAVTVCGSCYAAEAESARSAANDQATTWVKKKIYFTYQGFTTHYSCEGLQDKVRLVLLQLGARKQDMNVHEAGCTSIAGRPEPFPAVSGTFYVLQPVAGEQTGSAGSPAVAAHWQTVQVRLGRSGGDSAGQCELLEQVKEKILPLFNARNVQFQSNCVPHQLTMPGAALQVEVLKPDQKSGAMAQTN